MSGEDRSKDRPIVESNTGDRAGLSASVSALAKSIQSGRVHASDVGRVLGNQAQGVFIDASNDSSSHSFLRR